MRKIFTVAKNELIRYFVSPLAYVYLFCFVLLNASFATYFGDFFNRGQADLQSVFMFQPWLYLLFIPGISMRLWAEEFHSKTVVQIVTQPISITALAVGKFLAAWLFCGLALVLTFPFWLTVNALGNPDNFVIFIGYCGSFILAGAMLAVSQTMSALTKNQIIALVLAVIANLLFFWSGIEYVLAFCRMFMPPTLIDVIASFSFLTHFNNITYGLIELRDFIFFAALILFCLYTTVLIVNVKTAGTSGWLKSSSKSYNVAAWLMLLAIFFGINILANNLAANIQYDATEEKNYTLTESTRHILEKLKEPVLAKLYFSPILEQRNPDLREQFNNIRILLHKYKSVSKGKFDYKIYYPKFLDREEDIAIADGVQPIPLIDLNQTALFGLTVEDTLQNKEVIPFFAQSQYGRLEQDITTKIYELNHQRKTLGILSGLPIFGESSADGQIISGDPWQIVGLLEKNYRLHQIQKPEDFDEYKFDVLMLFYPHDLSKEMIEKIKEYSRNSGKIVLILDPANEASRLYAPMAGYLKSSSIGELEQFWRLKLYQDYVVADLQNSVTVDATTDYTKNPVFSQDVIQFKIKHEDMNPAHPVTQNLHEIMFASASLITPNMDAYKEKRIIFYPLLRAGDISELVSTDAVIKGVNPQELLKDFQRDGNQKILAAEIIGLEEDRKFDLIAVADSDFLYDQFWMNKVRLLESEYVTAVFDNANFLLNAVDYLAGNTELLGLRGKRALSRGFDGIEILRRINSLNYKQEETKIFEEIEDAKHAIQEVWAKKEFEDRENFTPDELAAISKIRQQLNDFRQKLSDLRYQAQHSINDIGTRIAFLNIWAVPLFFGTILLLMLFIRLLKHRAKIRFDLKFNRRLFVLCLSALSVAVIAVASVLIINRSSVDAYENKLVFPNFAAQLNNVDTVILKTNKQQLTFELKDNMWILKEMPDLPVYQERIRRLLTTVADARYFARKSDKAENLAMFNLLPIEDENSGVTRVIFKHGDNEIQNFNLGDIDIDIGRGLKSAYIRFDNQFQVWEINADFVSMDLDWHNWTYSHLWDLRFGRPLGDEDNPYREQYLMNVMRLLLNTPYIKIIKNPQTEPLATVKFNIEGNNKVDLSLHKNGDISYAAYSFDASNSNPHLKTLAQYLNGKACVIENDKMEKLLDVIK
ncbi:MAG: Gldg family protein [Alphaproteobacteria bacterium]|nr:Gldg family protein [Alphaproteobacteria bacterium]